jgi:lipopolysaccharide/colanic/teichoic acid biosynthesis glycosyltransferase
MHFDTLATVFAHAPATDLFTAVTTGRPLGLSMADSVYVALFALWGLTMAAPYAIYPLMVRVAARRAAPRFVAERVADDGLPFVSVLVPAHNEAAVIAAKIENALAFDYPHDRYEIIVGSDGSTDGSDRIVQGVGGHRVRLFRRVHRAGKPAMVNALAAIARGEIMVMTDASAMLTRNALREFVAALRNDNVGVASARYVVRDEAGGRTAESSYWSRETALKLLEAHAGMLLGAHGAGYAIRSTLFEPIPTDTVNDDFVIPMKIRAQGYGVAYLPHVVASDRPTATVAANMHRFRRIARGNWQMLARARALLTGPDRAIATSLIGHKLLKTLGPVSIPAFFIATVMMAAAGSRVALDAMVLALVGGAALLASTAFALAGAPMPRMIRLAALAGAAVVAYTRGTLDALRGQGSILWVRPEAAQAPAQHDAAEIVVETGAVAPPKAVAVAKRTLDLVFALVALVVFAPLMASVALLIKFGSPGPVIFTQERLGAIENGRARLFRMYKFRSMRPDAEAKSGPVWATRDDPRITPVGRFLRKTRLDELPQFFNVLKGDMTIVGPRPERAHFTQQLSGIIPGYYDRHAGLKPGITGWAQVNQEYDTSIDSVKTKVFYDLVYVAHLQRLRTYLAIEFAILFRTVAVVVLRKGAH